MSTSHFDILILGSSPAARMAAALCAKGGRKVLLLEQEQPPPPPPWCHASLHLERLLEALGGRACLQPTPPFQVHTDRSRWTLHGRQPLAAELLREFRQDQPQLLRLLEELQTRGQQLEERLWRCQGLPLLGWRSRLRFVWQLLRRWQIPHRLNRPLSSVLGPLRPESRAALETLFSGLALTSASQLSLAEAALLWHCASRIEALNWRAFSELLDKRFDQFHGKVESAAAVLSLERRNDQRFELSLKGHPAATATWLLLGDRQTADRLPQELTAQIPDSPPQQRILAAMSLGRPSPLLAPGTMLDHPGGLRLSLPTLPGDPLCIEAGCPQNANPSDLLTRVEAVLPFTELAFLPTGRTETANAANSKAIRSYFPGARGRINLAPGLLFCDGQSLLPHLGLPGEAILGYTAANHLLGTAQNRTN